MKNISQSIKVILLAIVLSFGISYVFAWTAPTLAPTGGNSTAPLNTSNINQTKNGNLFLNALAITNPALGALSVAGGGYFGGNVGIGTMSPNALLTLQGGKVLLKQNVVTGTTGANNIGFAIDTGASTGEAASMGIFKEAVNGASSLVFKNWNGSSTVETARISSNGNLTATGVICDSTGCIGGATTSHGKQRFTSSGTFTVPAGVTKVWVSMSGGGGGGGGTSKWMYSANGGNGGPSTFGAYINTPGGGRGGQNKNSDNTAFGYGGNRGGSGGSEGVYGWAKSSSSMFGAVGGDGGDSIFGGGGGGGLVTMYSLLAVKNGKPGSGYGSGGGGGSGDDNSDGSTNADLGAGGGGGAHAVIAQEVTVTGGENIAITVGAGGAGGSNPLPTLATKPVGGSGAPGFVLVEW